MPFSPNDPFKDFFDRFFKDQMPREFKQQSLGSGFVIDKDGFILTNNHVVEKSDEIRVRLADEKEFAAKIIGRDPKTDLALIKIDTDQSLVPLPLGNSDDLEVGEWLWRSEIPLVWGYGYGRHCQRKVSSHRDGSV